VEQDDAQAAFRSDFRDHTLVFTKDLRPTHTVGFEVRDTETLERAADALTHNGYDVTPGSAAAAARRKVKTFLSFNDASGVTIDLVVRPLHSGWRYFPSRDAGVTGPEAVALRSSSVAKDEALWTRALSGEVKRLGWRCRLHTFRQCASQAGAASVIIGRRTRCRVPC
jgi:2,3-dihydroxy-p-cumate/2,3-dihydroxybenzoate 3,4-dioxygenase